MRQRMKKISACFLMALAVLISVLSVPVVAYAADNGGGWVPFVYGGAFLNPSEFVKSDIEGFDYLSMYEGEVFYNISTEARYRIRIVQFHGQADESDTGWFDVPMNEVYLEDYGTNAYQFVFDTAEVGASGNLILLVQSMGGMTAAGLINQSVLPFGDAPFLIYIESYVDSSVSQSGSPAWDNGQFVNQPLTNYFGKPVYRYGDKAPVPNLVGSRSGQYKITYNGVDYIVSSDVETSAEGAVITGFKTADGTLIGAMGDGTNATSGTTESMFLLTLDYVEGATLTMTVCNPFSADLPTFFGEAGNFISWLITTFGAILAFMLRNPISFIWIIVSLVVVVVKILQNTAEN